MAESLPSAPAGPGRHSRHRTIGGWHVVFAALAASTASLLLLTGDIAGTRRVTALVVLGALTACYAMVGARALHSEDAAAGRRYVALALPLTVGLFAIAPVGALMLFMLYPHIWALLRPRVATAATVLTALGTVAALWSSTDSSDEDFLSIAVMVAVSVVIALLLGLWITHIIDQSRERARLVAELAATQADLETVSREAGMLAERERLARDIHDTLAQGYVSVMLLLEAAETEIGDEAAVRSRIDRARQTAAENLTEARTLVAALTPPQLRESSLVEAVRRLVDRMSRDLPTAFTLQVRGEARRLPAATEVVLLRAVQEALANARRHAAARTVEVELEYRPDRTLARVSDDGRGFDAEAIGTGFGMPGMRDRLAQIGGSLAVDSRPGGGTTVCAEVPT